VVVVVVVVTVVVVARVDVVGATMLEVVSAAPSPLHAATTRNITAKKLNNLICLIPTGDQILPILSMGDYP